MRVGLAAGCTLAAALLHPHVSAAQSAETFTGPWHEGLPPYRAPQVENSPGPLVPAVLSLTVPGAGQHVLGHRRKWAYLALEVAGWAFYLDRRSAGRAYRDLYRDYAWENGRIQSGSRIDGDFEYYETLSKWVTSGSFDLDPDAPGVQPELDAATYNGSIWTLATEIFLPGGSSVPPTDPAYQSALRYYVDRAYAVNMLWDWTGSPGGQQELGRLIEASDDRFRQATTALGIVIANHLLSAGDAYLSALGRGTSARLRIVPGRSATGSSWEAVLSLGSHP